MANNPVQIVLNHEDFITAPEKARGGPTADPFKGRDKDFVSHKKEIRKQIAAMAQALDASEFGEVGYARVVLQESALAKSNRPVRAMFPVRGSIPVGAGNLGELFYRVTRKDIDRLAETVESAEETAKCTKDAKGNDVALASPARADVAAIAELSLPDPQDKRNFDVRDGVEWLDDPNTDGRYQVELFEKVTEKVSRTDPRAKLFSTFRSLVRDIDRSAAHIDADRQDQALLSLQIHRPTEGAQLASAIERGPPTDRVVVHHRDVLSRLADHPLVRKISLPLRLQLADKTSSSVENTDLRYRPTRRNAASRYPKVGIIDSGIDDSLAAWIESRSEYLDLEKLNREHGTQVAGLLVEARNLNGDGIGRETDGCLIYDVPLFIEGKFRESFASFEDFLNQIDLEVGEMAENHGVRVFNMSITADSPVDGSHYGRLASRLDEIQAKHDVIFVISAGNLKPTGRRSPWPAQTGAVLRYFAARTETDPIFQPADSVLSICVGAVNPDSGSHVFAAPTTYTCRGPGLRVGCKPDVAHFGGALPASNTGLATVTVGGVPIYSAGTSLAAPLVSKTLATIDAKIEDTFPTHTLHALLVHHSELPDCLMSPRLRELARQFCGFGLPCGTEEMLTTDDSAITLVFNSALPAVSGRAQIMRFDFNWPAQLVDDSGRCTGIAKMTLVSRPPLDPAYGAEFVRVNLDAKLQQRQAKITRKDGGYSYRNEIEYVSFRRSAGQVGYERELIKHGLKWWPVKKYEVDLGTGVGASSRWRVEVDSVTRSGQDFPENVPFSLVLTIRDPQQRPIFQGMRRSLEGGNVALRDIRVTSRARQRSRG